MRNEQQRAYATLVHVQSVLVAVHLKVFDCNNIVHQERSYRGNSGSFGTFLTLNGLITE